MTNKKINSIARNAVLNVVKTMATFLFPLITFMYASRIFSSDGLGRIEFAQAYTAYFVLIGMLGVEKYGTREAAKARDNRDELSHISQEIFIINIIAVIVAYILLYGSICLIKELRRYETLLLINSISIAFTAVGLNWLYAAVEDYHYITIRTCIVNLIALVLLFLLVHDKNDINSFALIQTVAATGANVLNLIHSRKYIYFRKTKKYSLIRHIKPIGSIFFMNLFIELFTHLDKTMLGFISGDVATGLYAAAHKVSGAVAAVITASIMVFLPRISYYIGNGERNRTNIIAKKVINIIMMMSIPAAVGIFLMSKQMVLIFSGDGFILADNTAKILSFRILMSSMNAFLTLCLFISFGLIKNSLFSTGAAAILNFVLNSLLIPVLAQNGAAISTIFSEGIELIVNIILLSRIMPIKPIFKNAWEYMVASLPIIPISFFIRGRISNSIVSVVSVGGLSCILYFLFLVLLNNEYIRELIVHLKLRFRRGDKG